MKKDVVAGLGEIGFPIQKLLSRTIPVVGYDKKTELINTKNMKTTKLRSSTFAYHLLKISFLIFLHWQKNSNQR